MLRQHLRSAEGSTCCCDCYSMQPNDIATPLDVVVQHQQEGHQANS